MRSNPLSHRIALILSLGIVLAAPAAAQVTWITDEAAGIATAKREDRLIVFFFTSDERGRRKQDHNWVDRTREGIRISFRGAEISQLAQSAFVMIGADIKRNGALIGKLNKKIRANHLVITKPDLTVYESLDANAAQDARRIHAALERSLQKWKREIYDERVRPDLRNAATTPDKQRAALNEVRKFALDKSDADVIQLLAHDGLNPGVRSLAFDVLAEISSEATVKELMGRAAAFPEANLALRKCKPRALSTLADYLEGSPSESFLRAYRTIAVLARVAGKGDQFWKTADDAARAAEIARIKKIAAENAGA